MLVRTKTYKKLRKTVGFAAIVTLIGWETHAQAPGLYQQSAANQFSQNMVMAPNSPVLAQQTMSGPYAGFPLPNTSFMAAPYVTSPVSFPTFAPAPIMPGYGMARAPRGFGRAGQQPAYYPGHNAHKLSWKERIFGKSSKFAHQQRRPMVILPQFQQWVDYEPQYKLFPGDQVDIVVSSAPELSRTLTVGPDGRIVMPMSEPIMAAGRTYTQVQKLLVAELGKQLRDPRIAVTPRAYGPQQIFVGGEVRTQGTYTMQGPMGALEAILMAGGLRNTARTTQIAVLRRAPNGGMMMRPVNIGGGLSNIHQYNDVIQLRRGDIIFVPKTTLAEIGIWMQNLRGALPFDFSLTYQFGNNADDVATTIVQ